MINWLKKLILLMVGTDTSKLVKKLAAKQTLKK